jgi:sensor histidine kinase YesM
LIYLIYHTQKIRAKRKYETEKRIAELQLRSIKGQTDPHFTLNLLNSMGALFDAQDKRKAGYIFGKYAKMLRTTILSSERIDSTLETELEFVENYLELEKFRFSDKFEYRIEVGKEIDTQIPIPKMLLHTFVENAVKHGIRHRDAGGMITLNISNQDHHYLILIRDNGPGHPPDSERPVNSTGKGLKILDDILRLYFELRKVNISYIMEYHNGQEDSGEGVTALIKIPVPET